MISKEKLNFDVTDNGTIADSDSVGAFVRAGSDGDLIASQTLAGEEWLNVASILHDKTGTAIDSGNPLPVDVTGGVNVEVDLSHVDDSVALGDGTNLLTSTTIGSDIGLDVNIINTSLEVTQGTSPWVVSASDLDIRDLIYTSDSVTAYQGGTWTIDSITNDVNIADGGNSITVDAVDLDIRNLTHASDSVRLGDGTNFLTSTNIGSDYGLDIYALNDPSIANVAIKTTAKAATNTQSALLVSALANRKFVMVQNLGNRAVFLAESGATDAQTTGLRLSPGSIAEFKFGPSAVLDVKASGGTQDVRVLEAS